MDEPPSATGGRKRRNRRGGRKGAGGSETRETSEKGESLAKELSEKLTVEPPKNGLNFALALRPDKGGDLGQLVDLISNHYQIKINGKILVYQYDVKIVALREDGKVANRRLNREDSHELFWKGFVQAHPEEFPRPSEMVYDQMKQLYSIKPVLAIKDAAAKTQTSVLSKDFPIIRYGQLNGDTNKDPPPMFKLTVSSASSAPIEFGDFQSAYRKNDKLSKLILELLFRQELYFNDSFFPAGRNFYFTKDHIDLGCGREIKRGWYQAVRPVSNWKVTFTLDVKAGVFYKPEDCVDIVKRLLKIENDNHLPYQLPKQITAALQKEIKGLKLKATHIGHRIVCSGISNKTALTAQFQHNNQMVTVDQYFRQEYGINLRFKNWPLVMKGRSENARLFPLEVCKIADKQRLPNKKIDEGVQAEIVKTTVIPPEMRRKKITEALEQINMRNNEHLREYGVSVNMKPMEPKGRILEPPRLQYKESKSVKPVRGSWNMSSNQVYQAARNDLNNVRVLCMASQRFCTVEEIKNFCYMLGQHANNMGLRVALERNIPVDYVDTRGRTWCDYIEKGFKKAQEQRTQMIIVIMDGRNAEIYALVKKFGEQACDILTQCVQVKKVKDVVKMPQRNAGVLSNICLKINSKMGGTNVKLVVDNLVTARVRELLQGPVIFLGADVTHPDPGDKLSPSIAGIASSMDNIPGRYLGIELLQGHRKECINELKTAVKTALLEYFKLCRMKPVKIIFYRDGVSEGQFNEVLNNEMVGIQEACKELETDYKPARTFIVVQKRHNTRLFLKNQPRPRKPGDQIRPSERNIAPGTTVDTDIVHPEEFDFYLSSHEGIQGTSKPTHYHVLHDDTGFSSNELQQLTYYLCHTYARCTRSVSLPAPVYYAHHIAYRARMRLKAVFDSEQSASAGAALSEKDIEELASKIKVAENMQKVMYWN